MIVVSVANSTAANANYWARITIQNAGLERKAKYMLVIIDRQDGSELQTYSCEWKDGLAIEECIGELGYVEVYYGRDDIDSLINSLYEQMRLSGTRPS